MTKHSVVESDVDVGMKRDGICNVIGYIFLSKCSVMVVPFHIIVSGPLTFIYTAEMS